MLQPPVGPRPLALPELYRALFVLYRQNFLLFVGITALIYIPLRIVSHFVNAAPDSAFNPINQILFFLLWLAAFPASAALTQAVSERYLGQDTSISNAYSFALGRFFPFVGTMLMVGVVYLIAAVTVNYVIGVLLLILVFFWLAFINPVFVVEGFSYLNAMKRSRELAKRQWLKILLVALPAGLLALTVQALGIAISIYAFGETPAGLRAFAAGLIEGGFIAVSLPIALTGVILLYFDVRARKENYDRDQLAQDMADRAARQPPPPPASPPHFLRVADET